MSDKSMEGAKVLVTGGAGFIGSELTRQLWERGAAVTVVDNLVNGRRDYVEDLVGERCRFMEADVRNTGEMASLVPGLDLIFHLACLGVRHSIHSPRENHDVNATATLDLLTLARDTGVGRFVHISSSEVYGTGRFVPMTEDHPTYPMTVYGASKLAGEAYARAFYRTYGYNTVVVRPFNNYGPRTHHEGDSGMVIPKFMLRAMAGRPLVIFGDGTQTRDFLYVTDSARGIIEAALCESATGETFNIGLGSEIQVNDLARQIGEVVGREVDIRHEEPRPGDTLRLYSNTMKANAAFGFVPRVGLREGLQHLRDWYLTLNLDPEELLKEERVRNWEVAA